MSDSPRNRHAVRVRRNGALVHIEEVWSRSIAEALATHYEGRPGYDAVTVDLCDMDEPSSFDIATHGASR